MAVVFTTAGLELFQTQHVARQPVIFDKVQIGTLNAGQRYDATENRAALVDPNPLELRGFLDATGSGPKVEYGISLVPDNTVTGSEVGFFSGETLAILWAEQAEDLFDIAAGAQGLLALGYEYTNGVPSNVTLTASSQPIASFDQARAREGLAANDVLMTPRRTWDWWNAVPAFAISKVFGLSASLTSLTNAVSRKANSLSPTLGGIPRATTAPADDNSTRIATTAHVKSLGYRKINSGTSPPDDNDGEPIGTIYIQRRS